MPLGGRRWFSLSLVHRRQALFTPYIEPMNKGQEKTLRRLLLREEPKLHPRIPHDVDRLLQVHSPKESKLQKRKETITWLNNLISTTFGAQFSVQDISLGQYARDLEYAPLELVIMDESRRDGFPPGTENESRKGPYDPMNVIKLLQGHGYTGTIVDGDAFNLVPLTHNMQEVNEREPPIVYPSWSEPKFFEVPYIRYPVVLHAEAKGSSIPFHLSPPAPTLAPLNKLLRKYLHTALFKNLVTFVYFWVRTIGMDQLSPTCVALMVIGYLQSKKGFPVLQQPRDQPTEELRKQDTGVWVVADFPPRFPPRSFYIETGIFENEFPTNFQDKQIKALIYGFLDFWSMLTPRSEFVASEQFFSVRHGHFRPRESATLKDGVSRKQILDELAKIQCGLQVWSPLDSPITWRNQPIVIEDPFLPSFNHARTLTPHASRFFHNAASVSRRTLHHGHPVGAILGQALSKRHYSSSTFSQQIKDSYKALTPPYSIFERRRLTISRIERVIRIKFGNEFRVSNFGSTRYGISLANSDLDLVILDPARKLGLAPNMPLSKLPQIYSVKHVGQALADYGFSQVYVIPTASVPIVRCRDPTTGIDCDININDRLGLINTKLVENYFKFAPDIKPMSLAVKRWAKHRNLNDSSGLQGPRTFSSYTLNMMIIGYLQIRGVLPNLQQGFPPLPSNPRFGIFYVRRSKKVILCDTRFEEVQPDTQSIGFDLGETLLGWFNFWGHEFDYMSQILSVRDGGLLERTLKDYKRFKKVAKVKAERGGKGKKTEPEPELDPSEVGAPLSEMDKRLLVDENVAGETEDEAVMAWHEQEQESEDEVSEGLPAELSEITDETIADTLENVVAEPTSTKRQHSPQVGKSWGQPFVVLDPFLQRKNLTSHFSLALFQQFQSECRSAVDLLKSGGTLEDLVPPDQVEEESTDDSEDSSSSKTGEGKKKKIKKSRLGIHIKPSGDAKDIDKIVLPSQPQMKKQKKKAPKSPNKSRSSSAMSPSESHPESSAPAGTSNSAQL